MAETAPIPPSSLLNYLPGIYREDPFLGKYLLAFEQVLLGRKDNYDLQLVSVVKEDDIVDVGTSKLIVAIVNDSLHIRIFDADGIRVVDKPEIWLVKGEVLTWLKAQINPIRIDTAVLSIEEKKKIIEAAAFAADYSLHGLEENIATIFDLFDPAKTPQDFLPWLASWVAFSIWSDISEAKQREFIANMMELYRWRGTEKNLIRLFEIYTGRKPSLPSIADEEPHYFKVLLDLSELARGSAQSEEDRQQVIARQIEIAHALIRQEKPAHTRYTLNLLFPSFQIGRQQGTKKTKYFTQVGINTRLGVAEWSK